MQACRTVLILCVVMVGLVEVAAGQKSYPLPPGSSTAPAAPAQQAPAAAATPAPAAQTETENPPTAAPPAKPDAKEKGKSKKVEYSGPTEVIVLPPAQMVDSEGRPVLDPDGKPMYNPPQKQQRDKKGHPLFDDKGKPLFQTDKDPGYDDKGKKIHVAKEKPPKLVPMHIARGTFSVDGVVGKAALNYDIPDLKYMYMFVPGIGVAIVSNVAFPGATEEKNAFNDRELIVAVGDHKLELASESKLIDKDKKPESAFVRIDRDFTLPSRFPVVGYGTLRVAPYAWPGAKPNAALGGTVEPPPLPKNLQPTLLTALPCPKGQARLLSPKAEPGKPAVTTPCMTPAQIAAAKDAGKQPEPTMNYGR
jgi:hypothetical protein